MIAWPLLTGAATAAAVSTLTPGPAFLSLLGIGAVQGRPTAARFILGHLAGDIMWSLLAMTAIVGSRRLGSLAFELLGVVCALYLGWLGCKALLARRGSGGQSALGTARPLLRGIAFGLTNPKGYPVSVALFTAFLAGKGTLTWAMLPGLEAAACVGYLSADVVVILLVGLPWARRVFARHETAITRMAGLVFIGFALETAYEAVGGLRADWNGSAARPG